MSSRGGPAGRGSRRGRGSPARRNGRPPRWSPPPRSTTEPSGAPLDDRRLAQRRPRPSGPASASTSSSATTSSSSPSRHGGGGPAPARRSAGRRRPAVPRPTSGALHPVEPEQALLAPAVVQAGQVPLAAAVRQPPRVHHPGLAAVGEPDPPAGARWPRTRPPPRPRPAARPPPAAPGPGRRSAPAPGPRRRRGGAAQLPQAPRSTALVPPRPFELRPPTAASRRAASSSLVQTRVGQLVAARGGCGSRLLVGMGGIERLGHQRHPHLAQEVLVPLEVAAEGVGVVGVAARCGARISSRVSGLGGVEQGRDQVDEALQPVHASLRSPGGTALERGDQLLDPLVPRLERVLAQHRPLGLVVELQVDPVDGEVPAALLGPPDELAPQLGPGRLGRLVDRRLDRPRRCRSARPDPGPASGRTGPGRG